jgi:hypothetical protein
MSQHEMDRMVQHRIEDASEAEYDEDAPPRKRRKISSLESVQSYAETSYENTHTHGNARAHYGHVYNYVASTDHPAMPQIPAPMYHDQQSAPPDPLCMSKALRFDYMNTHLASMRPAYAGTCEWLLEKRRVQDLARESWLPVNQRQARYWQVDNHEVCLQPRCQNPH